MWVTSPSTKNKFSSRFDKEWENQNKNPENEVVKIPNGSTSPSLSSPNIYSSKRNIPSEAGPGIYKKGECPPP